MRQIYCDAIANFPEHQQGSGSRRNPVLINVNAVLSQVSVGRTRQRPHVKSSVLGGKSTLGYKTSRNAEKRRFIGNVNNFLPLIDSCPYSQNNAMLQHPTHATSKAVFLSLDGLNFGLNCVSWELVTVKSLRIRNPCRLYYVGEWTRHIISK